MDIRIRNFRGVEEAELTLGPIALVAGPNEAGKTSLAEAVAAALTRNPVPIDSLNKGESGLLLRDGTKRGNCIITAAETSAAVAANWPGGSITDDPGAPRASELACGLVNLATMKPKDVATTLIAALKAEPSEEELRAALAKAGIEAPLVDAVWARIVADGWDEAHGRAQKKSPAMKGAWEQITGERWGAARASTWRAPGLVDGKHSADLVAAADAAHAALEAAIARQAVSADEVDRLNKAVATGKAAADQLDAAGERINTTGAVVAGLVDELDALPQPETAETQAECPHCQAKVVVVNTTTLRKPASKISARENTARKQAIDAKVAALSKARLDANGAVATHDELQRDAQAGTKAATRLAGLPQGGATQEEVDDARAAFVAAQGAVTAATRTEEAEAKHKAIVANAAILEVLAPTGVRQAVLAERHAALNTEIAALCTAADWPEVRIEDDLRITADGRPYVLLAESVKFRARVVIQAVLARHDGSAAIIVDAADILDKGGRNGLFRMLKASGMRALVTMTMNVKADVPNLRGAGLGASYWLAEATLWPCHT